jgi:hypothetical protein
MVLRPDRNLADESFLPLLSPPDWAGRGGFACRPLLSGPSPFVVYGWATGGGVALLAREEALVRGWGLRDLEVAARAGLRRRPTPAWRPLWIGVVSALAAEGDEHTAAQILRKSVLVDLQRRLECERVALGVPHRGALIACDADVADAADLAGLVQVGFDAARVAGRGPVCPWVMIVKDGEIQGVVTPHAAEPVETPERQIARKLTPRGALVLRADDLSEESLVKALGRELPQIAEGVQARGGFRGQVKLAVGPAGFPPSPQRRMRLAALEQMVRELAATKGLRAPSGKKVQVKVIVDEPVGKGVRSVRGSRRVRPSRLSARRRG